MNLHPSLVEPEPWIPDVPSKSRPLHSRRSLDGDSFVLASPHPSIPTIIITTCQEEHDVSCRVPLQNSAFHNQLTVPGHPAFNHNHPPLALTSDALLVLSNWRWKDGHWQGNIPSLDEQDERGLFSRALVARKRTWRTRRRP
jgi:hypothetical protein